MGTQRHISLLLTLATVSAMAQDPQLSQYYAAPLYLNPAMTGTTFQDRLILNFREQWLGIAPGYETYAFSYDHNSVKTHSGFGGMVLHDQAGSNNLAFTQIAASYAYEAHIDHSHGMRMGLRLGYTIREYDPGSLLFADQVIRDNAPTSIEPALLERASYMDVSAGGLYFSEASWFGFSFNHLNRPQQTLLNGGDTPLPIRMSLNTGYKFALDKRSVSKSSTLLTLAAHYKAQDKWDQLDIGGYIQHQRIGAGLWYRGLPGIKAYQPGYPNDDAIILMVSVETENQLRLVYSYDITISWLTMKSGGSHELSLQYEWPRRSKNRRYKAVPCPKF